MTTPTTHERTTGSSTEGRLRTWASHAIGMPWESEVLAVVARSLGKTVPALRSELMNADQPDPEGAQ